MKFLFEGIFTPNELGGYDVSIPEANVATQGDDLKDAVLMGHDALRETLITRIQRGVLIKDGTFNHPIPEHAIAIGLLVDVDGSEPENPYMTVQEAADLLDVSTSRIYSLIRSGLLVSKKVGTSRMVLTESVKDRLETPPHAGRPKSVTS